MSGRMSRGDGNRRPDPMRGYKPLIWSSDSPLSAHEQEMIEIQRRDLWRHGIRREPLLTRMAFEFGYVVCLLQESRQSDGCADRSGKEPGT